MVVTALGYFGTQFVAGVAVSAVALIAGVSGQVSDTDSGYIAWQFLFVLFSYGLLIVFLWLFLRSRRTGFKQLGLGRHPAWRDVGYALLGYAIYFGLSIVVITVASALTGINLDQKQEHGFDNLFSTSNKLMALVALAVLPPIVEEILFRGFLFTGLRKKFKFVWATIITSLVFAGPHLLASSEGLLWVAGVDTLVLSFILCYLREKTGALWAPMAVHAVKNSIAFILLLSVAAL